MLQRFAHLPVNLLFLVLLDHNNLSVLHHIKHFTLMLQASVSGRTGTALMDIPFEVLFVALLCLSVAQCS